MTNEPHSQAASSASRDARARVLAARTKRVRKRQRPLEDIDKDMVKLVKRLTPPEEQLLSVNAARAITSAQTLRKEIQLAKFKAEELEYRLEDARAREELELLKDVLREHGILVG